MINYVQLFIVHLFCVLFLHFRIDIQQLPTRMTGVDKPHKSLVYFHFQKVLDITFDDFNKPMKEDKMFKL